MSETKTRKGPKFDDEVAIRDRRLRVAKLYMEGFTQQEIANKVGVSQPTVSLDIKAVMTGWEASAILDWDAAKSKELAALEHQESELWEAWRLSLSLEQVKTRSVKKEVKDVTEGKGKEKKVVGSKMVPTEVNSKKVEKRLIGDPRVMAEITKVRELRCRIFGFLKDDKKGDVNIGQINVIDWEALAGPVEDEIEKRLQLEQAKVIQVKSDE